MTLRDQSVYQGGPGVPPPPPPPIRFSLLLTDYSPGGVTADLRLEPGGNMSAAQLGRLTVHPDDLGDVLTAMLRAWLHPGLYQR